MAAKKRPGLNILRNNMKIGGYVKEYTAGNRITLKNVASEIKELIVEVVKMNKEGIIKRQMKSLVICRNLV